MSNVQDRLKRRQELQEALKPLLQRFEISEILMALGAARMTSKTGRLRP